METVIVEDQKTLDELYGGSAFTMVGLRPSRTNLEELLGRIKALTPVKRELFYVVSGSLMNKTYGLTGDIAYPETDYHLVCMSLEDITNLKVTMLMRLQIGGWWFDDIVDNALRCQRIKDT